MAAKKLQIEEADIQEAIRRFQARGGLIKKLPDQPDPVRNLVGAKWGIYEPVFDRFQTITPTE